MRTNLAAARRHWPSRGTRGGVHLAAATLAMLLACAQAEAQVPEELARALPNLAYSIDLGPERSFPLIDGRYSSPAEPIEVRLLSQAYGDVDGDGWADAAVILNVQGGGSGRFVFLSAVLNSSPAPQPLPAILLGDRVPVRGLRIDRGVIRVTVCERAPEVPMASGDCTPVERSYALNEGRLVSLLAAAAASSACLEAARQRGMTAPRVAAQRFVGGPIWLLRIEGDGGPDRRCTFNVVTRQAELE